MIYNANQLRQMADLLKPGIATETHIRRARSQLRDAGLRVTEPRVAVLSTLLGAGRPLTASELIAAVSHQEIDVVTVYRILQSLLDANIARAVGTTQRGRRFESHTGKDCPVDHPHLQCRSCGIMTCIESSSIPTPLVPVMIAGFQVEHATLCLTGICARCREP